MGTMGMSLIGMLLLSGNVVFNMFLTAPPRDLASLLEPNAVLTQMGAKTDEASLIALLGGSAAAAPAPAALEKALADLGAKEFAVRSQAAETLKSAGTAAQPYLERGIKSDDPEVRMQAQNLLNLARIRAAVLDADYLKRLYAIRMLEQMKAVNALPALAILAKDNDPTLANAAAEAILVIQGKPIERPAAADLLKARSAMLPADAEIVLVMDLARDAKDRTIASVIPEIAAELAKTMGPDAARNLERLPPMAQGGLLQALSAAGNVRVDAVVITVSGDETPCVAMIFKGQCDPVRVAPLLAARQKQYVFEGHTVCFSRNVEVCLLDKNTLVYVVGGNLPERTIAKVIAPLTAVQPVPHPAAVTLDKAFALVLDKKARFAISGALSDAQKAAIRQSAQAEIARIGNPDTDEGRMRLSMPQIAANFADATEFVASPDALAKLAVTLSYAQEEAAGKMNAVLSGTMDSLKKVMAAQAARQPNNPLVQALGAKQLCESSVRGKDVVISGDLTALLAVSGGFTARAAVARPREQVAQPAP